MTLLAETILATVTSTLDAGIPTATVERGRVDELTDTSLPFIGVFQGSEQPTEEPSFGFLEQYLEVRTSVAAGGTSGNIETTLNDFRNQIHLLLMADNALGLAYVIDIIPNGVDEPELDGSSDKITGSMVVNWLIHYRHQYADAGLAP